MKRLAILGASGHGKVIADTALLHRWGEVVFFDDAWPEKTMNGHWSVSGKTEDLLGSLEEFSGVVVGIGACQVRWEKNLLLRKVGAPLVTLIHPMSYVSSHAKIGDGTVLFGGAVVNTDAIIGESCIVNTGATVDHDCVISNGVHVAPGVHLSGDVYIGERSWIGVGVSVKQGVRIGADVVVGAGAVVIKDVEDHVTVIGNPAAPLE